jgi:hypothetical protein
LQQLAARVQRPVRVRLRRLAQRVIELIRQKRLGRFSVLHGSLHAVGQSVEILPLLLQIPCHPLTFVSRGLRTAQPRLLRAAGCLLRAVSLCPGLRRAGGSRLLVQFRQPLRQLLLIPFQLPRVLAHLLHGRTELPRRLPTKLVAKIV